MPYIATIGFYRISQKCGASRALLCFYKLGFNCSCNRKTRQIMCIHECACSCNKIICIIHLLYLDVLQAFAEPRVSGFAIIVGEGVRKQNEYVFNKFIYFYIIFSLQWLKQTFCWFQFHSASPWCQPQACLFEYYEDEAVTQKNSKRFQCIKKKKKFKLTCSNVAGIWDRKINNIGYCFVRLKSRNLKKCKQLSFTNFIKILGAIQIYVFEKKLSDF